MTIISSLEEKRNILLGYTPIFVYATLKKGFFNNYILDGFPFIGNATTREKLIFVRNFSTPVLIKNNLCDTYGKFIKGEVYGIKGTDILDRIEGNGLQTEPRMIPCTFDDDETERIILCRTYIDNSHEHYLDMENEEFLNEWVKE